MVHVNDLNTVHFCVQKNAERTHKQSEHTRGVSPELLPHYNEYKGRLTKRRARLRVQPSKRAVGILQTLCVTEKERYSTATYLYICQAKNLCLVCIPTRHALPRPINLRPGDQTKVYGTPNARDVA